MFLMHSIELTRERWKDQAWLGYALKSYDWLDSQKATFLNRRELNYFLQLRIQRRRSSYLLGRFTAKRLLCHIFTDSTMTDWWINAGVFCQPMLFGPKGNTIQLSISHTGEYSYVLVYPIHHLMAVDTETVRPGNFENISSQLTVSEREYCQSSSGDTMATIHWTAKEALSKVLRTGMTTSFHIFEIEYTELKQGRWYHYFKNFSQYKAVSWLDQQQVVTIVLPKNTGLNNLDILSRNPTGVSDPIH